MDLIYLVFKWLSFRPFMLHDSELYFQYARIIQKLGFPAKFKVLSIFSQEIDKNDIFSYSFSVFRKEF